MHLTPGSSEGEARHKRHEQARVVALDLRDRGPLVGGDPRGAKPPELRDPGFLLRPLHLGEATQDAVRAILLYTIIVV
jgi:hypothetical protein